MPKQDLETVFDDIKQVMLDNLNTKIAAINTEKADTIILDMIDPSVGYHFQTLDAEQVVANPFIFYGIENMVPESNGPYSAETVTAFVTLIIEESGQDVNYSKRMLRYMRVLKEVFGENWMAVRSSYSKHKVTALPPGLFQHSETKALHRAVGIELTLGLG